MGPLQGIRVLELVGQGPAPFTAMVLADLGADVLRVDRLDRVGHRPATTDVLGRSRPSAAVDLKHPDGARLVARLAERADVLVEGFRPGVMERLGLGPDALFERNPRLVYGRMTGWGQTGPLATAPGHDINYIGLTGALDVVAGPDGRPTPPANLVGDFGGGGMLLVVGILAALLERAQSNLGQVVDAAMIDGSALLAASLYGMLHDGHWRDRGTNLLDGGAHFYRVYECSDGRHVAVGAIEPDFYERLLRLADLEVDGLPRQMERSSWAEMGDRLAEVFRRHPRDEWVRKLDAADACVTPVLALADAPSHPHHEDRATFVDVGGVVQPAPAPRFSRSTLRHPTPAVPPGASTNAALLAWGIESHEVHDLADRGVVATSETDGRST